MFCAMIDRACADCVPADSVSIATFIAARTSGGRSVDVRTMSASTLSKKLTCMRAVSFRGKAKSQPMQFRTERDPLGEAAVPADAYDGIQTARAAEDCPISGLRAPAELVTATILAKKAAAEANAALGRLDARVADAIVRAADEILAGALRDQFIVDVYPAGAGTSPNLNANEVPAKRPSELLAWSRDLCRLI